MKKIWLLTILLVGGLLLTGCFENRQNDEIMINTNLISSNEEFLTGSIDFEDSNINNKASCDSEIYDWILKECNIEDKCVIDWKKCVVHGLMK